jgi:ABC-type uncharacterized transport system ATPase subunit
VRVRILDEPTEGLDPSKRGELVTALADEARRGVTVLLSSHHLAEVESVCDRLVFFHEGRILADESPAVLRERARRLVRLGFAAGADVERVASALTELGLAGARARGQRVSGVLPEDDPRPFLARLATRKDLPAPLSIAHGELSLRELYRELYGVEGI